MLKLSTQGTPTQLISRCVITGNKKRVNNSYNYSRLVFLRLARFGSLNGLRKAAW